jgi:hypothetical protein
MSVGESTIDLRRDHSDVSVVMAYDESQSSNVGDTVSNAVTHRIDGDRLILVDYETVGGLGSKGSIQRPNPIVIHERYPTAAAARNAGLALVKTPYVIFVVPKHQFSLFCLDGLLVSAERANADITVGPTYSHFVHDDWGGSLGHHMDTRWPPPNSDPEEFLISWLRGQTMSMNAHLWRTDFIRQIGGWRQEMLILEEVELIARAILLGAKIATTHKGMASSGGLPDPDRVDWAGSEEAILSASDGFLALAPLTSASADVREALGKRLYDLARPAFRLGLDALGAEILQKARGLGLLTHPGTLLHKASAGLLGLERKEKMRRAIGRSIPALATP